MKKILAVMMAAMMLASLLAGCGSKEPETTVPEIQLPADSLTLLNTVWGLYGENDKFPVMGGDMDKGNWEGPDSYDLAQAEAMSYNLLIPQDQIANVTDVASMIHAMNANTFTGAVYRLADGVSAADFGAAMQTAIQGNMWMCGFPEKLLVAELGGAYVVVAFGLADVMTPFQAKLSEAFPEATVLVDEAISA